LRNPKARVGILGLAFLAKHLEVVRRHMGFQQLGLALELPFAFLGEVATFLEEEAAFLVQAACLAVQDTYQVEAAALGLVAVHLAFLLVAHSKRSSAVTTSLDQWGDFRTP